MGDIQLVGNGKVRDVYFAEYLGKKVVVKTLRHVSGLQGQKKQLGMHRREVATMDAASGVVTVFLQLSSAHQARVFTTSHSSPRDAPTIFLGYWFISLYHRLEIIDVMRVQLGVTKRDSTAFIFFNIPPAPEGNYAGGVRNHPFSTPITNLHFSKPAPVRAYHQSFPQKTT